MRVRKGDIVAIRFLDHAEDSASPMEFVVYGRVGAVSPQAYTIVCWDTPDCDDMDNPNLKVFSILRQAVLEVHKLTRRKIS